MRGSGFRRIGGAFAAIGAALSLLVANPALAVESKIPGRFLKPRYAAILVDPATKEVLYSNAADQLRHPASITKIMTLYMAFEAIDAGRLSLNDRVPISRFAASQRPSRLGLAPGKSLSVDQAIRVIAVKSANDIAVALAEKIGGSEKAFAGMMNSKARSLGMTNTNFVNASGLPNPDHVTTARDLSVLAAALLRNHAQRYAYFSQQKYQYEKQLMANHNKMLGRFPGMDGIKTGFTADAGFTLAASAIRGGKRLIAVVLGEPSSANRDRDVGALLDAGFDVMRSRSLGAPQTVASLLGPSAHPAIRITEGSIEQGSGDDATRKAFTATPAPVTRPAVRPVAKTAAKAEPKKGTVTAKTDSKAKARPAEKDPPKLAAKDEPKAKATASKGADAKDEKKVAAKAGSDDKAKKSAAKGETKAAEAAAPKSSATKKTAASDKPAEKKKPAAKG